jgi:hypothetical protein
LASPPLSDRFSPSVGATRDHIFVFGGAKLDGVSRIALGDGAVLNVGTGEWHSVADAPFSEPLYAPGVVSTDSSVYVVGHPCAVADVSIESATCAKKNLEAAEYIPAEDKWESLPSSPLLSLEFPTPRPVIGLGERDGLINFLVGGAEAVLQYSKPAASWSSPGTAAGIVEPYCGSGSGPIAVGGAQVASQDPENEAINSYRLNEVGEWEQLPGAEPHVGDDRTARVICGGSATALFIESVSTEQSELFWVSASGWIQLQTPVVEVGAFVAIAESRTGTRFLVTDGETGTTAYRLEADADEWMKIDSDIDGPVALTATITGIVVQQDAASGLRLWRIGQM